MEAVGVFEMKPVIPHSQNSVQADMEQQEEGRTPEISFTNLSRSNSPLDPSDGDM